MTYMCNNLTDVVKYIFTFENWTVHTKCIIIMLKHLIIFKCSDMYDVVHCIDRPMKYSKYDYNVYHLTVRTAYL